MKHHFWRHFIALFASIPYSSLAQPSFGFEVGGGAAIIDPGGVAVAPALNGRAGITLGEHFTGSLRGLAVLGSEGAFGQGGYQAWAAMGELRLHSRRHGGAFQPFLALGVGGGKLVSANSDFDERYPIKGTFSHYVQITVGTQLVFKKTFSVALELGANDWNGLSRRQSRFTPPLDGNSRWGGIFLMSFGARTDH